MLNYKKLTQDLGLPLILLLNFSLSAQAEIYQWRDAQGNAHFSDRFNSGATPLTINPGYGYYQVAKVFDGDTIKLNDGRRVRLLAVNTPEVARWNSAGESGGEAAKQWLTKKLQGQKVRLEYDREKKDKFGRTLAHVFTDKGEHINLTLVSLGLAHLNVYPSNRLYLMQLTAAEQLAEQQAKGLWALEAFQAKSITQLDNNNFRGWQRLTGQAKAIEPARKYVFLPFSDNFSIRIDKKDLHLFPPLKDYLNQPLELRGWLYLSKMRFVMTVRHPSQIKRLQ